MMKTALLMTLMTLTSFAQADVWQETQRWNDDWEKKFSDWVKSPAVYKEMFVSPNSRYHGVIADCADVAYAFRVIFAYENGLPFSAKNPVASATSSVRVFSNRMTRFDNIRDADKRVVGFINFLNQSLGTETLAANDSYPLKLDRIIPGDFYLYKVIKNGAPVRHNYNIKQIDQKGNFDLIYSTQAIRDNRQAMNQRQKDLYNAPRTNRWGFRRYDFPDSPPTSKSDLSFEQYTMAGELGDRAFFAHVKSQLAKETETPESRFRRQLREACDQLVERIDVVEKGVRHQRVLNGACMNPADYDIHSTPSRDGRLKDMLANIELDFKELSASQKGELSGSTLTLLEALTMKDPTPAALAELGSFCPLRYREGVIANMRDIRERSARGRLSSHPNDSIEARWGEATNAKTKCPAHY